MLARGLYPSISGTHDSDDAESSVGLMAALCQPSIYIYTHIPPSEILGFHINL